MNNDECQLASLALLLIYLSGIVSLCFWLIKKDDEK